VTAYYGECDRLSCARHVEAKDTANRLWARWNNISDRVAEGELRLAEKADRLWRQFDEARRGIDKCCGLAGKAST